MKTRSLFSAAIILIGLVVASSPLAAQSGTMTIGGSSPDYATFSAAVSDLVANGISGPVVYDVRPGTYNEQVSIPSISGASATNTITFKSSTGIRSSVVLTASGSSSDNYVLEFSGCDYVTFKDMTLTTTGTSYARVVYFDGGAEHCTLENLDLNGSTANSTSNNYAVIYSYYSQNHYATIRNCDISGGGYASVYWYDNGSYTQGFRFENNTLTDFYYMAMYMRYLNAPVISKNTITRTTGGYYYRYGIYMYYCDGAMEITGNKLTLTGATYYAYGIMLYYCDSQVGQEGLIANNFVTVNGNYGGYPLYSYRNTNKKFYFNTVYRSATTYSYGYGFYAPYNTGLDFQNNIVEAGNAPVFYSYNSNFVSSDYNVLNTSSGDFAYYNGTYLSTLVDWQTSANLDANSITKPVVYTAPSSGDLHLTGPSENDSDLYGSFLPEVDDDIDGQQRHVPYRGADEACYIEPNTVWFELTDANGIQAPYINIPGTFGVHYHVAFPDFASTVTVTMRFYSVPANVLTYTTSFQVSKQFGVTLDGLQLINISGITPGTYRVEGTFNTKNSCGGYRDYVAGQKAFMLLPGGQTPCIVWPGDVNNDGIVNYGDRKSLNTYIHDANLSPVWLSGPARYRADIGQNPFTYLNWEPQAAVPWQTPEGCYMDADGNGMVNSFDYIGIKMNWMRVHDPSFPKAGNQFSTTTFDVSQNYPNPFNPTTRISYSVPERSEVRMVATDLMGRTVATLVDGTIAGGVYTVTFDGTDLSSGSYIVTATMQGLDSGLSYSKTIRMTLSK